MRLLVAAAALPLLAVVAVGARQPPPPKPKWPNLDLLRGYPNKHGTTCPLEGKRSNGQRPEQEKARQNKLKNRYHVPKKLSSSTLNRLIALAPEGDINLETSGITVAAYVHEVKPGGRGETCNCGATKSDLLDAHIELIIDPLQTGKERIVVVETNERVRRLAKLGLLSSNIGNDWSTTRLKQTIKGKWVRISGWLFFDEEHRLESFSFDPDDRRGRKNWRATAWEIHPVMGIEVLPSRPW